VGRERKKFAVNRALIRSQSTFFNDAFIETDPSSLKTELYLPYDSVSIFEIYMGWIYRGRLVFKVFEGDALRLGRLFQIFHVFQIHALANLVEPFDDTIGIVPG